ncbi:MAG: copper resistance CopC family protein [Actinomycetota bacterium]
MRRLRNLIAVGAVTGLLMLVPNSAAWGHAAYKDSDPPDESSVSSPPSSVWAEFTEPPDGNASSLSIYDPCGAQVDGGDSQATGYRLTVSMSGEHAGTYRVDWAVLSSVDGHTTRGSFTFAVTGGPACPGADTGSGGGGNQTGGGSGSGGGGSQGDSGGGSGSVTNPGAGAANDTGGGGGGNGDSVNGAGSGENKTRRERDGRNGDGGRTASDLDSAAAPSSDDGPASEDDDIPIGGLLIALAIAALIGAAGGRVYVGLMGR